jgi:ribosomal protein S18 acetylase RimI-like enzyme
MRVVRMQAGDTDHVLAATALFDGSPTVEATDAFLASAGHHLLVAYEGEQPVGFVSGVELLHPDKGRELFLYELGVDEEHRRRGIATALVDALAELARERGCYGMWVLTEPENAAALATYRAAGGEPPARSVTIEWRF